MGESSEGRPDEFELLPGSGTDNLEGKTSQTADSTFHIQQNSEGRNNQIVAQAINSTIVHVAVSPPASRQPSPTFLPPLQREAYLRSLLADEDYREWQAVYTPTIVEDRKQTSPQQFSPRLKLRAELTNLQQRSQHEQPESPTEQREQIKQLDVLEGLRQYATEHVLMVGKPGSGKSTSLEWLLWQEAGQALSNPITRIPVLVKLRRCTSSIEGLIQTFLSRHQLPLETTEIEQLLFQGQFLLLLDGLNEIPDQLRPDLANFRDKYRATTPMIVSTRDLSVGGNLGITNTLKMLPLTEPQLQEFVRGYLGGEGDRLFQQLKGDRLQKFAETPLLLWMLCRVFAEKGQVPDNLGLAFREFTQLYDQAIQADAPADSRDQWPKLLRYLAFALMHDQKPMDFRLSMPKEEAENLLTNYLQQEGRTNPRECAERWLKDLLKYHLIQPVMQPNLEEHIEFRHQLIQEYYAAEYLLRLLPTLSNKQLKRDYLNYLKWTEPIALMLALMDDVVQVSQVVELALEVDWILGARLAGEVKQNFQEQSIGFINKLIAEERLPEWLKVELLGRTRSDVAFSALLQSLNSQNIEIARTAAAYIGQTNNQAIVDILMKRLEEIDSKFFAQTSFGGPDQTGTVWTTHVEALAYIAPQAAIQFLRRKLRDKRSGYILTNVTQAPQLLMKLDAKTFLTELIEELKVAESEHKKNQLLNVVDSSDRATTDLIVPKLVEILEQEQDISTQVRLIKLLGKSTSELATRTLIRLISHASPQVWHEVRKQLIQREIKDCDQLENLLTHQNFDIAISAAFILASLGKISALPILLDVIKTASYPIVSTQESPSIKEYKQVEIRVMISKVLGSIHDERSISCLLNTLLTDDSPYVRREAAFSLSNFGRQEAIPELRLALGAGYLDARTHGIRGLAKLNVEEPLWNILQVKGMGWQATAIELGKLGRAEVLPYLRQALVDPGYESSGEVIHLLSKFADLDTCNWLVEALDNPEVYNADQYFCNRIAFVLVECCPEIVVSQLPTLKKIVARNYIQQIFWIIPAIQNRCQFYNYEIFCSQCGESQRIQHHPLQGTAINAEVVQIIENNSGTIIGKQN